jgi:alkyl hydroperoxide reductase subunit F
VPGVFAAGDATTVPYKQIVIAMGEGAQLPAALSAFDHLIRNQNPAPRLAADLEESPQMLGDWRL